MGFPFRKTSRSRIGGSFSASDTHAPDDIGKHCVFHHRSRLRVAYQVSLQRADGCTVSYRGPYSLGAFRHLNSLWLMNIISIRTLLTSTLGLP